jgi:hypothetical protein
MCVPVARRSNEAGIGRNLPISRFWKVWLSSEKELRPTYTFQSYLDPILPMSKKNNDPMAVVLCKRCKE